MRAEDVRAYLQRDWDRVADEKLREIARLHLEQGAEGSLRASEALYQHALLVAPPTREDREADFRTHVAWRALLDRIARALAGR